MINREGRQGVEMYTAQELHRFLVADAVKGHATTLSWAVAAYQRIGSRNGKGAEAAFQAVMDEVKTLTGGGMPVIDPAARAEIMAQLKPADRR